MACNGSGCKSNCYKDEEEAEAVEGASCAQPTEPTKTGAAETNPIASNLCIMCKVKDAISGYVGVDDGRFCADCFRNNMFGKFRVALQFVHDMQHRAQKNFDASRDRSLPIFGVGVVFIDESAVSPIPSY